MRAFFLAVSLLALSSLSAAAAPAGDAGAADWRQAHLPDAMQGALRSAGYGLLDDGRVLDPKTRTSLTEPELAAAIIRIDLATERLSLERLRLVLAHEPLSDSDRAAAAALEGGLPRDVAKALESRAAPADLRTLADQDLTRIAAYFDGSHTPAERAEAAAPVQAGAPGPRAPLPYFDPSEKNLGDSLRAAAAARIANDPFGRTVLARLDGADGKPDLPPIVVENLSGDVAEYDYRRRALVLDQSALAASVADGVPAKDRGALENILSSRQALIDYLNIHPGAVAAFAAQNDVLLVHELTHAWQDRRDPIMQEMSRDALPGAVVIDYEEEAWLTKNLYLQSKLKHDPASVADDVELSDYRKMSADPANWLRDLRAEYAEAASNAMNLATAREIQAHRLEMARARPVADRDQQTAKSLDLLALTRADKELAAAAGEENGRVQALLAEAERHQTSSSALLASYYLQSALHAPNAVEFSVRIRKAEDYAVGSGDAGLLAKVRAAKGKAP
ncbi:MAG: hypothetical protein ACHQ2Z_04460 [Elusimicrobiota bacterium]